MVDKKLTLDKLKINETGVVSRILCNGQTRSRLLDMGITNGTLIKIVKRAPLGDPLEICLRGFELTMRESDAKLIEINQV
jgi:Fe2+ transport system protein FeoA